MPAIYCFTEMDQIADFKVYYEGFDEIFYDELLSASEPVIIGKTNDSVIESVSKAVVS